MSADDHLKAGSSKDWNWHPDLPVAVTPLFSWPPRPIATLRWFATNWLPVTEFTIYALMAWVTWIWIRPELEVMTTLQWGWVFKIWALNIILMTVFAQGLHVWLYGWKRQGETYKYDRRGLARNNRTFLFNDQFWDNVTHTLLSGVTVWTIYAVILWMAYANGWGTDGHLQRQSGLVHPPVPADAGHPVLPFLLAAPGRCISRGFIGGSIRCTTAAIQSLHGRGCRCIRSSISAIWGCC